MRRCQMYAHGWEYEEICAILIFFFKASRPHGLSRGHIPADVGLLAEGKDAPTDFPGDRQQFR